MANTSRPGRVALVTGATSGIGFEAAAQLAEAGWSDVIVTGRTLERANDARIRLSERSSSDVFRPLALDLGSPASVSDAAKALEGTSVDGLVLNAGMGSTKVREFTSDDVELIIASSLIGHHRLTMQLLGQGSVADNARLVISGSETARGDVTTMNIEDLAEMAQENCQGDLVDAAIAVIRGELPATFSSKNTYATAKLFVAWWAAALARRLPVGTTVNAVSPGSTPGTEGARNAGFVTRRIMMPMLALAPARMQVASPIDVSANRYLEALAFPASISGAFYASAPKKLAGPIEAMTHAHLHNVEHQEAAWAAIAAITGHDVI